MTNNEVTVKDVRTALNIFNNVVFHDVVKIIEPSISLTDESVGFVIEFKTVVGAKLSNQVTLFHKVPLSVSMSVSDIVALIASNIMSGIIQNAVDLTSINTVGLDPHAYLRNSPTVMGKERECDYNVSQPDKVIEHFLSLMRGAIVSHNEAVERMRPLVNNPTYIVDKTEYLPRKSGPHISLCVLTPNGTEHTHIAKLEALEAYTELSVIHKILLPVAMLYKANEKPSDQTDQEVWFQKFWTALTHGVDRFNSCGATMSTPMERRVLFNMRDTRVHPIEGGAVIKLAYVCNGQHGVEEVTMTSYGDFTPGSIIRNLLQPAVEHISIQNGGVIKQAETPVTTMSEAAPTGWSAMNSLVFREDFINNMREAIRIYHANDNPSQPDLITFRGVNFTSPTTGERYSEIYISYRKDGSDRNRTFLNVDSTVNYTVDMIVKKMLPALRKYLITGTKPPLNVSAISKDDWLYNLFITPKELPMMGEIKNSSELPLCGVGETENQTPTPTEDLTMKNEPRYGVFQPTQTYKEKFLECMNGAIKAYGVVRELLYYKNTLMFVDATFVSPNTNEPYEEVVINYTVDGKPNKVIISVDMDIDYSVELLRIVLLSALHNHLLIDVDPVPGNNEWIDALWVRSHLKTKPSNLTQSVNQEVTTPSTTTVPAPYERTPREVWFDKFRTALSACVKKHNQRAALTIPLERRVLFSCDDTKTIVNGTNDSLTITLAYSVMGDKEHEVIVVDNHMDKSIQYVVYRIIKPLFERVMERVNAKVLGSEPQPTEEQTMKNTKDETPSSGWDAMNTTVFREGFLSNMREAIWIYHNGDNPPQVSTITFRSANFTSPDTCGRYHDVVINYSVDGSDHQKAYVTIDNTVDYTVDYILEVLLPSFVRGYNAVHRPASTTKNVNTQTPVEQEETPHTTTNDEPYIMSVLRNVKDAIERYNTSTQGVANNILLMHTSVEGNSNVVSAYKLLVTYAKDGMWKKVWLVIEGDIYNNVDKIYADVLPELHKYLKHTDNTSGDGLVWKYTPKQEQTAPISQLAAEVYNSQLLAAMNIAVNKYTMVRGIAGDSIVFTSVELLPVTKPEEVIVNYTRCGQPEKAYIGINRDAEYTVDIIIDEMLVPLRKRLGNSTVPPKSSMGNDDWVWNPFVNLNANSKGWPWNTVANPTTDNPLTKPPCGL